MPADMRKTSRFLGFGEDGEKVYYTTFDSQEPKSATVQEWAARRRAALQFELWQPAVAAAFELLDGADAKTAGKHLDQLQRYDTGRLLAEWQRQAAPVCDPAATLAGQLAAAWTRCWGNSKPARASRGRMLPPPLPAAGTGLAVPHGGPLPA